MGNLYANFYLDGKLKESKIIDDNFESASYLNSSVIGKTKVDIWGFVKCKGMPEIDRSYTYDYGVELESASSNYVGGSTSISVYAISKTEVTTTDRLQYLLETKAAIKQALITKGQAPTDVFRSYAENILAIKVDDGINNPIVVTTTTELANYLTSDYQGKILHYTGDTSTYKNNTYYRVDNNGNEYVAIELIDYPTETETFTTNGTYDVATIKTVIVNHKEPEGTLEVTENGTFDCSYKANVRVNTKAYIEVESESNLPTTANEGTIAIVVGGAVTMDNTFTIKGNASSTVYEFNQGMTWEEWVSSDYNTDGYWIFSSSLVESQNERYIVTYEEGDDLNSSVRPSDFITANTTYYLAESSEPQ